MKVLVTGGAGFIGFNLVKVLLDKNINVVVVDNYLKGKKENTICFKDNLNYEFYNLDISNTKAFCNTFKDEHFDIIYHLAANTDIRIGESDSNTDYKNTFKTTISVLELMKKSNIKNLFFASTSAIYGSKSGLLNEQVGDLRPISYYGSAKLASENFIFSYSHMNDLNALIFRFPNVIGPNITHGVIYDFYNKLMANSTCLEILGDGCQTKPYMYVSDLIDAIIFFTIEKNIKKGINIYNIGVDTSTSVNDIANIICEELGYKDVLYKYTGGKIGWKGDIPKFQFDLEKIHKEGWNAKYTSDEAVKLTIKNMKGKK